MSGKNILRFKSASDISDWTATAHPVEGKPLGERRKVLLAYDSSRSGDYALEWAFDGLLKEGEDHLIIVTAVEPTQPLARIQYLTKSEEEVRNIIKRRLESVRAVHDTLSTLCRKRNISAQSYILEGDARDVILDVAERARADVIVMGARGLNAMHRAVLGSSSLFVTQQAEVPVVVVKKPKKSADPAANKDDTKAAAPEVLPLERTDSLGSMLDWLSLKDKSIEKRMRESSLSKQVLAEE
ncbi:hypothetical protein H9P43_004467 [Blastocladiella emersonii ATCC 22665]|nr:hypothetical protein H9P43_004467 [Blastocladiella emersonii ATCC 22665]